MKFTQNLEKLIPFGYLYLVIMGILKESIFYSQLNINILKFSNLMDILISPISDLTSNKIVLIAIISIIILFYFSIKFLSKNHNKIWVKKMVSSEKLADNISEEKAEEYFGKIFISVLGVGLLSFFFGIGIGKGRNTSEKIKTNNITADHKLTFNTGETKDIFLIGLNSANYIYIEPRNKNIKISPVGAVKTLELINK